MNLEFIETLMYKLFIKIIKVTEVCEEFKLLKRVSPLIIWILRRLLFLALILISVAFFTLVERKILGYSHERLGPNRVGYIGLIQPFRDAVKLFSKEGLFKAKSLNFFLYFFSPVWGIYLRMLIWKLFLLWGRSSIFFMGWVLFFCLRRFSAYFLLIRGWSRRRKYSLFGSYRSSSQVISYEVVMVIRVLFFCFLTNTLDIYFYNLIGDSIFFILSFPLALVWVISCYAETNRSPFDFREGESELVSGFNTEYGGGSFSLIFIGEYSSILFLRSLRAFIFGLDRLYFVILVLLVSFSYLWLRCSFPRLRYDKLIIIAWKGLIIYVLGILCLGLFFLY